MTELRPTTVAFLDILGYSEMVARDSRAAEPTFLPRILSAFGAVRQNAVSKGFDLRVFSDAVTIAAPTGQAGEPLPPENTVGLLEVASLMQWTFLEAGILVRGGLALGKHFADGDVVYSEAVIEAYRLENKRARVPRILVSSNLVDWLVNHEKIDVELRKRVATRLLKDGDHKTFVSYASEEDLAAHRSHVQQYVDANMPANKDGVDADSVIEKLRWLVSYHNHLVATHKKPDLAVTQYEFEFGPALPS